MDLPPLGQLFGEDEVVSPAEEGDPPASSQFDVGSLFLRDEEEEAAQRRAEDALLRAAPASHPPEFVDADEDVVPPSSIQPTLFAPLPPSPPQQPVHAPVHAQARPAPVVQAVVLQQAVAVAAAPPQPFQQQQPHQQQPHQQQPHQVQPRQQSQKRKRAAPATLQEQHRHLVQLQQQLQLQQEPHQRPVPHPAQATAAGDSVGEMTSARPASVVDRKRRRRNAAVIGKLRDLLQLPAAMTQVAVLEEVSRLIRAKKADEERRIAAASCSNLSMVRGLDLGVFVFKQSVNMEPLSANERMLKFFGYTTEEMLSKRFQSVIREEDQQAAVALTAAMRRMNVLSSSELAPWRRADGECIWLAMRRGPLIREGPPEQHHFYMVGTLAEQVPLSRRSTAVLEILNEEDGTTTIVRTKGSTLRPVD